MTFQSFVDNLNEKLALPLPGHESHKRMMHLERLLTKIEPNNFTKKSAVLVVFYPDENKIQLPLILRPAYDGKHGGQMALPGGKMELMDESLARTALREAQEEIGIKAIDVKILGELTEIFIPVSNFSVKPFVGVLDYKPDFFPDQREVEKIFEVSFNSFVNQKELVYKPIKIASKVVDVPGYEIDDQWVWGATALIMHELIEVFNKEL